MTRQEAIKSGAIFYLGERCESHPELKGQRRAKSGACHKCIRERMDKRRRKLGRKEVNRRQQAYRAEVAAGERVPRKYRKQNAPSAS